jgi:hypothetical protein
MGTMEASVDGICSGDFVERVRLNHSRLSSKMKSQYDFIICGSGSSGSVVARRLAENPEVSVLLIEAGGEDNVPSVNEPAQWLLSLGSERGWNFRAEPSSHLNGRAIPMNMGKVLGGGSSINVMAWARGYRRTTIVRDGGAVGQRRPLSMGLLLPWTLDYSHGCLTRGDATRLQHRS